MPLLLPRWALVWSALLLTVGAARSYTQTGSSPAVCAVYPSGDSVPENLLRFSLRFERPPTGPTLLRITLRREDGTVIEQPFLEQELWSPDGQTLTVLLHPGRVKSGLEAHDTRGPALQSGMAVDLYVDKIRVKSWRVAPAHHVPVDPARWTIRVPAAGTEEPLVIALASPIDALDTDYLAIVCADSQKVEGKVTLESGEREWSLRPARAWVAGDYRLLIHPRLEDPEGNTVTGAFERAAEREYPLPGHVLERAFTIREVISTR